MHNYYNPYLEYLKDERLELIDEKSIEGNHIIHYYLHPKDYYECPICKSSKIVKNGIKNRIIKIPIFNMEKTIIIVKAHRFRCNDCLKMFVDTSSSFPKYSNITFTTIVDMMVRLKKMVTFEEVSKETRLSLTEVIRIFDNSCFIPEYELSPTICFDEIKNSTSSDGNYMFVMLDPIKEVVINVLSDRRTKSLEEYFYSLEYEKRARVRYIVTDMYEPYRIAINKYFPNAIEIIDEFHYSRYMTDSMDQLRIRVMNRYSETDPEYRILKKFYKLLLSRPERINYDVYFYNPLKKNKTSLDEILRDILKLDDELFLGHDLLLDYYYSMDTVRYENALNWLNSFIITLINSEIKEFIETGRTFNHWKNEIANSFIRFGDKRLNNGPMEGMNARLKELIRIGHGYKSFALYRKRVMYIMNKDIKIKR